MHNKYKVNGEFSDFDNVYTCNKPQFWHEMISICKTLLIMLFEVIGGNFFTAILHHEWLHKVTFVFNLNTKCGNFLLIFFILVILSTAEKQLDDFIHLYKIQCLIDIYFVSSFFYWPSIVISARFCKLQKRVHSTRSRKW
jgi:hypothetical protein